MYLRYFPDEGAYSGRFGVRGEEKTTLSQATRFATLADAVAAAKGMDGAEIVDLVTVLPIEWKEEEGGYDAFIGTIKMSVVPSHPRGSYIGIVHRSGWESAREFASLESAKAATEKLGRGSWE